MYDPVTIAPELPFEITDRSFGPVRPTPTASWARQLSAAAGKSSLFNPAFSPSERGSQTRPTDPRMFLIRSLTKTQADTATRRFLVSGTAPRPAIPRQFSRINGSPLQSLRSKTSRRTYVTAAGSESVSKPTGPKNGMDKPHRRQPTAHEFLVYGAKLCVYHAGTGRITFLSCLKLSTLFIFAFFGFVVAPAYYEKEGLSPTVARTALCAVVPLVFVAYTTSPFVMFIHMRLPPFARQSEEMLRRFVRTLPPQTELEITTMSPIAKPRVSTVKLADLAPASRRLGIVNMVRDTAAENAARKWYRFRAVGNFNVQRRSGAPKAPWVWDAIWNTVNRKRS